jgi:RES domain-containing protein
MLPKQKLLGALAKITPSTFTGQLYRSISEAALHSLSPAQPLYSLGARKSGQRFTHKTGPASLYLSEEPDVSYIETNGTAWSITTSGQALIPPPTVIIAISAHIDTVLDLTMPVVQKALDTDDADLSGPWFEQMILGKPVPTQILARAAYSTNRFQAIRFKSVQKPGAVNCMIWPKRLTSPAFIEVHDPSHRLYQRIP